MLESAVGSVGDEQERAPVDHEVVLLASPIGECCDPSADHCLSYVGGPEIRDVGVVLCRRPLTDIKELTINT